MKLKNMNRIYGYVSPDEYLEMERASPQKHEYINGRIVARAGANKNHAEIISKLLGEIYKYLEDKPCRAYPAGLKVVTIGRESYTYPDMIIFCGPNYGRLHARYGSSIRIFLPFRNTS